MSLSFVKPYKMQLLRMIALFNYKEDHMRKIGIPVVLSIAVVVASCASPPGVVQLSPDTYMVAKEDHGGVFGSMINLKADVIREANAFAEKQGKLAIPISSKEVPITRPMMWASFEYQFRVVDKTDPEARRTSLVPRPDVVIEKNENVTADIRTKDTSVKSKDIYAELMKLDDLQKKGIITKAEFEAEKKKLLESK